MGKLQELMDQVFESDGSQKACGREICKELIVECNLYYPEKDFGDAESGRMNVEAIRDLQERIVFSS